MDDEKKACGLSEGNVRTTFNLQQLLCGLFNPSVNASR